MEFLFPAIVTVGGLVVAALNLIHVLKQSRGKRFYERSIQLLDLRERFDVLGPVTGTLASDSASRVHKQLLDECEREARANATLYVVAVSRLRKPGSYFVGFLSLSYALATGAVTGSAMSQLLGAGPVAVVTVAGLPGLATLLLAWSGARLVLRRKGSLGIRRSIGELDPLSKEGRRRFYSSLAQTWHKLLHRPMQEPPSSATIESVS